MDAEKNEYCLHKLKLIILVQFREKGVVHLIIILKVTIVINFIVSNTLLSLLLSHWSQLRTKLRIKFS
jgi:hypothetical protein